MNFKDLQSALKDAMKAHDTMRKEAVATLIASVKKTAIDAGVRENIPDDMVDASILKELKIAQEQLDTCPAECTEQLAEYKDKLEIIRSFAPAQMNADELRAVIKEKFGALIAEGNKGAYMKAIMAELKGKADGKLINLVISEIASGK